MPDPLSIPGEACLAPTARRNHPSGVFISRCTRMAATFNVCVVAPTTLLGETLLEILEARAFPVGELHVAGMVDSEGGTISFQGEDHTIQDLDKFDFSKCDLVFFCGDRALSEEYAPQAAESGAVVIDDSDAFRHDPEVPLGVPEGNI